MRTSPRSVRSVTRAHLCRIADIRSMTSKACAVQEVRERSFIQSDIAERFRQTSVRSRGVGLARRRGRTRNAA